MQRRISIFLGLLMVLLTMGVASADGIQTSNADASAARVGHFHTSDGRISHPFHLASGSAQSFSNSGWGGYVAAQSGHTESLAFGYFNIPASVSCNNPSNDVFAPWVGLDGYLNEYVEQAGVAVSCNANGTPVYQAWWEMYNPTITSCPDTPPYPVGCPQYISTSTYSIHAGDVIGVTVQNNSAGTNATLGNYTIDICDFGANGWAKTGTGKAQWCFQTTQNTISGGPVNSTSAEAVVESPSDGYPTFSAVTFANLGGTSQPSNCVNVFYTPPTTQTANNVPCVAGTNPPSMTAINADYIYQRTSTSSMSYLSSNVPSWIANNITFQESFVHE